MSRSMVGLLAAAGAIMSMLVGLIHGDWMPVMIAGAGAATGLAACLALPGSKKLHLGRSARNGTALMTGPRSAPSFR